MGKEQELVQAVKAEDVGTAQRLLQRPRPGKASECEGRGVGREGAVPRLGATSSAEPLTPPGAGRGGGDAVGPRGRGGASSAQTLCPHPRPQHRRRGGTQRPAVTLSPSVGTWRHPLP